MDFDQQYAYESQPDWLDEELEQQPGEAPAPEEPPAPHGAQAAFWPAAAPVQVFALFGDNGHFTDEGLQAIVDGTLDELQRLEAAEHLSFCDGCLERYTRLLEDDTLLTPARPIAPPVAARIRQRAVRILFSRTATAAAAACLALAIWGTGVFDAIAAPRSPLAALEARPAATVVSRMSEFFRGAQDTLAQSIDNAFKALAMNREQ